MSTCYCCEADATSREHAPPRCLFPKGSRQNLITVPSCDAHNSEKCGDDELLRAVILFVAVSANVIAKNEFLGKLLRAAKRRPGTYAAFFEDCGSVRTGSTRALRIDRNRFDNSIDHMVRAIYFNRFEKKLLSELNVLSPNFYSAVESDDVVGHEPTADIVSAARDILKPLQVCGENPDIFKFRIGEGDRLVGFACIFYDFFEVFALADL